MNQPLLSIVIPTKNRYPYLFKLLDTIDSFNFNEVEVVIQDNNERNEPILEYFQKLGGKPSYIKYDWNKESLPISLNSDYAILNSTGEYVCFIGDDDGVTKGIINQVKYLKNNGIEAMITRLAVYNWPDYKDDSIFSLSSTLSLDNPKGKNYILYSNKELKKVAKGGGATLGLLPRVYQGVVSRAALDKLYEKCGSFFPGPSPDMANAIALTAVVENYLYSDEPTIITGQSKFVGGGERLLKKLMNLSEIPHLPKDIMDYWDSKLPSLWCTDTIWPGSAIIAAAKMEIPFKINYNKIYGRFVYNHPSYSYVINDFNVSRIKVAFYGGIVFLQKFYRWAKNRISYYLSNKKRVNGCILYRKLDSIKQVADVLINL